MVVAGVDFGTLSVRVSIVDEGRGRLGSGTAEYPLTRSRHDPDLATERHADHMDALVLAMRRALADAGVPGREIRAVAIDTTGSSIVPVGEGLEPIGDYYLWCDHRAWREAREITAKARELKLPALDWCGGAYSAEWGFSKLLHWLRHNPGARSRFVTVLEHCDMAAAALCGITDPDQVPRSVCAMGHKWMWNPAWGGLPDEAFLQAVDPLLAGVRDRITGRFAASDAIAGRLAPAWASRLGLRAGIPIPVGALDAHWDAIGAGIRLGDVVNVIGTSTCIMAISDARTLVPGVCGVVPGSVHPGYTGVEAGLSATGDIFEAIARRAGRDVAGLSEAASGRRAGETGLLRLTWDNGDRTVLVNPELGGVTLGWNLTHAAEDELFAAIEGTAFHTRVILERMEQHGVPVRRIINAGGIPRKNALLNRVYASVLGKPVLVPRQESTSLGSAIFAFMAAGAFPTIEAAQDALCPAYDAVEPDAADARVYEDLFGLYRALYFGFGSPDAAPVAIGAVLPALRETASRARSRS
ncbi:MAG TPA: ribulokinase [Vicinamibacterales bacterium]|nr:ribulokinase [Vicinamibacterales bacterium]